MPISFVELPAGTHILLGPPAKLIDSNLFRAIVRLAGSIEDIVEAHLPQCFAVGVMEEPSQVLVPVLKSSSSNLDMI